MRYWRFVKNVDHEYLNCLNSYGVPAELADLIASMSLSNNQTVHDVDM